MAGPEVKNKMTVISDIPVRICRVDTRKCVSYSYFLIQ